MQQVRDPEKVTSIKWRPSQGEGLLGRNKKGCARGGMAPSHTSLTCVSLVSPKTNIQSGVC